MIHVVAQVEVKNGKQQEFLTEFRSIIPAVRGEAGCLEYGPAIDADTDLERQHRDAKVVTVIEKWESLDDLKAHLVAPHMLAYRDRVAGLVESSRLHILQPA